MVLISVDTLRADAVDELADDPSSTIAAWARDGVCFTQCRAHVPLTLPSHGTLLRGLLPPALGVHDNAPFSLPPGQASLATVLLDAGWATHAVLGGQPLSAGCGLDEGFETYDDPPAADPGSARFGERRADEVVDRAVAVLRSSAPERPLFLFLHCFDPHFPYTPPPELVVGETGEPSQRRRALYLGEVRAVDRALARLDRAIGESGRDTVVVFTADHGEGLGDLGERTHGYQVFDSSLRVPLLFTRRQGKTTAPAFEGVTTNEPVQLCDVMPTLLGHLGLEALPGRPGRDLRLPFSEQRNTYVEALAGSLHFHWAQITGLRTSRGWWLDAGAQEDGLPAGVRGTRLPDGRHWVQLDTAPPHLPDEAERRALEQEWRRWIDAQPPGNADRKALLALGYLAGPTDPTRHGLRGLEENRTLPSPLSRGGRLQRILDAVADLEEGRIDRASSELRTLSALEPDNPTVLLHLARAWRATAGRESSVEAAEEALRVLDRLVEVEPSQASAELLRIQALGLAGRFEEAVDEALARVTRTEAAADHWLLGALLSQPFAGTGSGRRQNPRFDLDRGLEHMVIAVERGQRSPRLVANLERTLESRKTPRALALRQRLEEATRADH